MVRRIKKVDPREETEAYQKVLFWFFAYPTNPISLSDLSKQLEISKTTTNKVVNHLVKLEFLHKEVLGKIWRISCNQSHSLNITRKIPYNLSLIYESGILEEIKQRIGNTKAIILFGSYRKGDDTEKSDIDIAVEVVDDEDIEVITLGIIPQLGYRTNVTVHLHIFSRNKINLNLFSNIANGIVLEGFLEVHT